MYVKKKNYKTWKPLNTVQFLFDFSTVYLFLLLTHFGITNFYRPQYKDIFPITNFRLYWTFITGFVIECDWL